MLSLQKITGEGELGMHVESSKSSKSGEAVLAQQGQLEAEYPQREVPLRPEKEFHIGDGRISAYLSAMLGLLSLLGVLAYLFPSYLTTTELRAGYNADVLQQVLKYGLYFSLFFAVIALFINKKKGLPIVALASTGMSFALGGYLVPVGPVEPKALSLGVDWLILALLGSVFVFTTLEKLWPRYREQVILRHEWELDLFYFCLNHLLISAVLFFGNSLSEQLQWAVSADLQATVQGLPIWVQVGIILFCADFVLYWEHRIFHEVPRLWKIHAVHHSVETLDWLAGSRGHVLQVFIERTLVVIPLYLLGVDKAALDIYVTWAALQAIVIHCNVGIPFGPLKYVLVTPQFHHWHHSSQQPALDTNYSAHTVLFDRLFGTYHLPKDHWPAKYGTLERLPRNYLGQLLYPFR